MANISDSTALFDPRRWGLPHEVVGQLAERLYQFWLRFRGCFKTRTRDSSKRAYDYLRGQLTMDTKRNFANIDRTLNGGDGQPLQHFMSNSPWSGQAVFRQIQDEIKATPALQQGSVLILDESADEKAGTHNAGAARQYNGRLGKVDLCRVDTCLAYANVRARLWTLVDGELFLPAEWFGDDFAERRAALGIPKERRFETKMELGLKMVKRAKANSLPFDLLACDTLYGRDSQFRADLDAEKVLYAAEVPANTRVYWREPRMGVPPRRHKKGRRPTRRQVLGSDKPQEVRALARSPQTPWQHVQIEWSCQRYFTERTYEDAKTEIGWDEFQAQKYRAWEHHLALTALALWFVAQTKLEWAQTYARDPELAHRLEVEVLPALSTANVRELLKAALPLPQLTPEQATELVITHLVHRARSTSSRLKSQTKHRAPP